MSHGGLDIAKFKTELETLVENIKKRHLSSLNKLFQKVVVSYLDIAVSLLPALIAVAAKVKLTIRLSIFKWIGQALNELKRKQKIPEVNSLFPKFITLAEESSKLEKGIVPMLPLINTIISLHLVYASLEEVNKFWDAKFTEWEKSITKSRSKKLVNSIKALLHPAKPQPLGILEPKQPNKNSPKTTTNKQLTPQSSDKLKTNNKQTPEKQANLPPKASDAQNEIKKKRKPKKQEHVLNSVIPNKQMKRKQQVPKKQKQSTLHQGKKRKLSQTSPNNKQKKTQNNRKRLM